LSAQCELIRNCGKHKAVTINKVRTILDFIREASTLCLRFP
jgi:hypothetical protein